MKDREALRMALEKVANALPAYIEGVASREYLSLIHKALAQPEQKPVLEVVNGQINRTWDALPANYTGMLYTTPPQRKPLTDEQVEQTWERTGDYDSFARAIEAAHGIKE